MDRKLYYTSTLLHPAPRRTAEPTFTLACPWESPKIPFHIVHRLRNLSSLSPLRSNPRMPFKLPIFSISTRLQPQQMGRRADLRNRPPGYRTEGPASGTESWAVMRRYRERGVERQRSVATDAQCWQGNEIPTNPKRRRHGLARS